MLKRFRVHKTEGSSSQIERQACMMDKRREYQVGFEAGSVLGRRIAKRTVTAVAIMIKVVISRGFLLYFFLASELRHARLSRSLVI